MDRIVFQKVGHGVGIGEIIDGHKFDLFAPEPGPKNQPPNSPKAIDGDID
jgi:hypothetical protein